VETPVETPMETPVETPMETPMETPVETPMETLMETTVETPVEPVIESVTKEISTPTSMDEKEPDHFQESDEKESKENEKEKEYNTPEESMDETPITTYDYDDESYYVDNSHFLERTFLFPDGEYPMNLCIYNCVRTGCTPYLLFLTVYDSDTNSLIFPTTESISINEEHSEEDTRSQIMENFKNTLFNIFPPNELKPSGLEGEPHTDIYLPQLYKGLFLNKQDKIISMVYDATRVQVPVSSDKEYFWVTPYEILVLYKYRNIVINDSVIFLFQLIAQSSGFIDKSFYLLKKVSDGSLVPIPYVLFPCSSVSSTFSFSKYENLSQKDEDETDLIIPVTDHPQLGNFPLFSALPLESNIPHIQRFAVFVDIDNLEPTFFDDENNTQLDHLYDIGQKEQYSAISFIEKDVQYWCIKSPLYFSEIYDDRKSFIPISTFEEVNPDELQNHVQKDDSEKEIREPNTENDDNQSEPSNEGSELSDEGSLPSNEGSFHSNEGSEISNEDQEELREPYEEEELDGEQMTLKEDTIEDLMNKR